MTEIGIGSFDRGNDENVLKLIQMILHNSMNI